MIKNIQDTIQPLNDSLKDHVLYKKIDTREKLAFFTERHVYAVLDFMSLFGALKRNLIPNDTLWSPPVDNNIARFLNEITMGEESDETPDGLFMSHFELYLEAMEEIGANTSRVKDFLGYAKVSGINTAMEKVEIPNSAKRFMQNTFDLIEENSLPKIAASFCFGREKSIPIMFQSIIDKIGITEEEAPKFHFYVKRHIEVDGKEHGPMAENLLKIICKNDSNSWVQVKNTSIRSLQKRKEFWDDIQLELERF